jgi:hypothetical protein
MVFETIIGNTSSTHVAWEEKTTHGHWCKTNFHNQILSQVEKVYTPYKYIKLGLQETNVVPHQTSYKDL